MNREKKDQECECGSQISFPQSLPQAGYLAKVLGCLAGKTRER